MTREVQGRAVQRKDPSYNIETISAVYADACEKLGKDWDDVKNFVLPSGSTDGYFILDWLGSGKYSNVFTAYKRKKKSSSNDSDDFDPATEADLVAIKVLRQVREEKYRIEAKILTNLKDGPNIIKLLDIIQNPATMTYNIVTEYVEECDFMNFFETMTPQECCFYLYQLMRAIQYTHSHGIMHRDIKPLNVLYDRTKKKLRLIDWGLAEFYHPKQRYNIHVATRYFKPIELLLDYQFYDYSVDIWSFGVTMAGMVFKRTPFFKGSTDMDMVSKIVGVLGNDAFKDYLSKYGIPLPEPLQHIIARGKPRPWQYFVNPNNQDIATPDALDLIDKCIRFDHTTRITADEALKHPYFESVRNLPSA